MEINTRHIIIMAGGVGSRFWPMSTPEYPKQFIDVLGVGRSLIQLTVDRFRDLCPNENIWIVTSEKYLNLVKEQLPEISSTNILLEPEARNTAPCISYACWKIKKRYPNANIVVSPSDAVILNIAEFHRVIKTGLSFTQENNAIVTIGIKPTRPETGYGYICSPEAIKGHDLCKVESFKEKPKLEIAQTYLNAGYYFWNAGIFIWNVDTVIHLIRQYTPDLAKKMDEMAESFYTENECSIIKRIFPLCEKVSIDYAVLEKAESIYTIPADLGWSDLGSWGALRTILPHDSDANVVVGDEVQLIECSNCVIHSDQKSRVVLQGMDGYIFAEKSGQILVCKLSEEQRIKDFITL